MADSAEERTAGSSDADEFLLSSRKRSKQENPSTKVPNNDPENKSVVPKVLATDVSSCQGQENAGSSGKRKHSRWDVSLQTGDQGIDDGVSMTKRRKTRWDDDDSQLKQEKFFKKLYIPVQKYPGYNFIGLILGPCGRTKKRMQMETGAKIMLRGKGAFIRKDRIRDPSDDEDLHISVEATSQSSLDAAVALVEKLLVPVEDERNELKQSQLKELAKLKDKLRSKAKMSSKADGTCDFCGDLGHYTVAPNPTFDAPSDLKQEKFFKKLYIPVQEYPGYNFIGLILGPCGRTKKRMQMETGAKIMLRGKGAFIRKDRIREPSDDEDLHIFVEATSQSSLDAAVALVENLLVPVEDERNELKQSQLKELAKLKDKLRSKAKMSSKADGTCDFCGDLGHYTVACPLRAPLPEIKIDENCLPCETCGDAGHLAVACPFYGTLLQAKTNNVTVLPALGDGFSQSTKPFLGHQPLDFRPAVSSVLFGGDKPNRGVDCTSLSVAHFPQYVDVGRLVQLFSPFGVLSQVKVIRDEGTGLSRGYGFVKYIDPTSAALAMNQMDGYRLDGNTLVVRVAGHQHGTPGGMQPVEHTSFCFRPAYPSSSATSHITAPTCWSGPPGSVLPETYGQMYISYGSSYTSPVPSSQTSTLNGTSEELARFPGNLDNFAYGYRSLFS